MTWTTERRAKQSQAIKQWKPWAKSTGAKTPEGKAVVSRNAFKGGHRPNLRQLAKDLAEEFQYTQRLIEEHRGLKHGLQH
jgi:hypothetical protein